MCKYLKYQAYVFENAQGKIEKCGAKYKVTSQYGNRLFKVKDTLYHSADRFMLDFLIQVVVYCPRLWGVL